MKALRYLQKNNAILYSALEEDFAMDARVQAGTAGQLWHGQFEQALRWFHQGLGEALGDVRVVSL